MSLYRKKLAAGIIWPAFEYRSADLLGKPGISKVGAAQLTALAEYTQTGNCQTRAGSRRQSQLSPEQAPAGEEEMAKHPG
ncbi:hypothetical protein SRHO_G00021270 [Serrasalmus rhombeus]